MKIRFVAGALCAISVAACQMPPVASAPVAGSGIARENFDPAVRPQDDFYRYVNGTYLGKLVIPADKSNYGAFGRLDDESEEDIRAIIEQAAAAMGKTPGSDEQKIGDLYASFMDEARADALGLKPLEPELARIDALKDRSGVARTIARLSHLGASGPIFFFIDQDPKQATQYIAHIGQATPYSARRSGLGMPDRDYYLSDEPRYKDLRAKYLAHVEATLALAGLPKAKQAARDILALETRIARIHWTRIEDRDSDKTYNKYALDQLKPLAPGFDWKAYLQELGIERSPGLIVRQPSYLAGLDRLIAEVPLGQWRPYFKWHLLRSYADYLSTPLAAQDFAFYGKTLSGIQEQRPRWKRGVDTVEAALGEALGRAYVERHFPAQAKVRMQRMVDNLLAAYGDSIRELEWMSPQTREQALQKLATFMPKIGYPDRWKDYSALSIAADDLVGNVIRSREVEYQRELAKLGEPIDRAEWGMTPQTVNAYYNPGLNEIVFPAAILQPPFFDLTADDAANYGAIGAVIGHEIGHGFDDEGSKYDGQGNLKSWWTDEDRKKFELRTKALIAQYDAFEPLPGQRVSGALTIGENIGDLGGLSIAYRAWKKSLGGREAPVIDGMTGDQRFFIGWSQVWARKYRDEEMAKRLKTDPHSPSEARVNGIVANLPQFHAAFGVKPGDKLYLPPEKQVRIW